VYRFSGGPSLCQFNKTSSLQTFRKLSKLGVFNSSLLADMLCDWVTWRIITHCIGGPK
jgi:hypothetical protein